MSLIQTKTADQCLILISNPKITSGNQNVDRLSVELDDTWKFPGLMITARFHSDTDDNSYIVPMQKQEGSDNTYVCYVPNHVEVLPGIIYVGIFCEANGYIVKTTNEVHITCAPGIDTAGELVAELLPEIITILRQTISSSISADITAEETKTILTDNLTLLSDLKAAYSQLVSFVNYYHNAEYSDRDLDSMAQVGRDMWDLGVQLNQALAEIQQLRRALDSFSSDMQGEEITLDGTVDVIINEVSGELAALINELEALRTDYPHLLYEQLLSVIVLQDAFFEESYSYLFFLRVNG